MDCNRSSELISLAIDQMISSEDLAGLETHLLSCESCKEEYELLQSIQQSLAIIGTEEAELPSGFHMELMQSINAVEAQEHNEMVSKDKVIPLWRRVDQRYMNVAAVMVMVVVFALIGVNNLDTIRQNSDSAVMENTIMTESAKEESASSPAPMMEAATEEMAMDASVEEESAMGIEKSDEAPMAADAPEATVMMEAEEITTEETTSADTSVMEEAEEVENGPVVESVIVEESDEIALTYEGSGDADVPSEAKLAESGNQLARESVEDQKSTRSVEYNIELFFDERVAEEPVPKGLAFMILGGFLGFMVLSVIIILRKLR